MNLDEVLFFGLVDELVVQLQDEEGTPQMGSPAPAAPPAPWPEESNVVYSLSASLLKMAFISCALVPLV